MRKCVVVFIAILALCLLGAGALQEVKKDGPVCAAEEGPKVFREFLLAILRQDEAAVNWYITNKKCGAFKEGIRVEVIKETDGLILVRVPIEGHSLEAFTVPEVLKE